MKIIDGEKYKIDLAWFTDISEQQWDRHEGDTAQSDLRQVGAIFKSGDRTESLAKITAPTLVIHGVRDMIVNPSGGEATAKAIKGAKLHKIDGMGHSIPESLVPEIMPHITAHLSDE